LMDGARKLGYTWKAVPQNISGAFADHAKCGASCTIGCRGHAEVVEQHGKMSGCRAFLNPLLEDKDGPVVKGMDGFEVERVLFSDSKPKRAIGAIGWATRGQAKVKVLVRAKLVVVSSGTLNSPAVLLRSGIKVSDVLTLADARTHISGTISTSTLPSSSCPPGPKSPNPGRAPFSLR
jgi:choline dehydrogenase-like flavoprotein